MNGMKTTCRKCGGAMKSSKALVNTIVTHQDFYGQDDSRGCTMSRSGEVVMVDCLKCSDCGHSVTSRD